jgi:signal transduction histidine kinase
MTERRSAYFVFQGLLTLILLLFMFYQREATAQWGLRLTILVGLLGGLLFTLAFAPLPLLMRPSSQGLLFLADILLSTLTLYWIQRPSSDLYLTYFLVIFGTAMTQSVTQSFLVALVATTLYAYSALHARDGLPPDPGFWLRLPYLWIVASFTAMLSRDTRDTQQKQEKIYQERLFHMERLAALGQVSAEIAHRIKAPLTTIRVNAEVLEHRKDSSPAMRAELVQIQQEVDHCKEILQKLLELGRIEEMDMQPVDLQDAVRTAIDTIQPQIDQRHIQLVRAGLEGAAPIKGDPILVKEAILAVLQNAVEAMDDGGKISLGIHWVKKGPWWSATRNNPDTFDLVIEDNGSGIEPDQLETIFRPFYTTKVGKGNGLGLSAALRIMDKHGGSIRAASEGTGKGASFTLTLPKEQKRS